MQKDTGCLGYLKKILIIVSISILPTTVQGSVEKAKNLYFIGLKNYKEGNFKQAINNLNKSIELMPDNSYSYTNRGMCWYRIGNFNKALKIDPQYKIAIYNKELISTGKSYDKGIEAFNQAIDENPSASGYYERGTIFYNKHNLTPSSRDVVE